jgi:hypothetical protein
MAPRVPVTTQQVPYSGLVPAHTAPTVDGDVVDVGRCHLSVINGGGAPITVTVQTPGVVDGDLPITDRVVTVPVGTTPKIIPLNSVNYKQTPASAVLPADAGRAYVDYSTIASVTRAVVGSAMLP